MFMEQAQGSVHRDMYRAKSLSTQRLSSTVAPPLQPCCNMRRRGATLWACKNTLLF